MASASVKRDRQGLSQPEGNTVLVKLVQTSQNSSVDAVCTALAELDSMFTDLNRRYSAHKELKESLIVLATEYREVHGRALRYVHEMKDFAKSAVEVYLPGFEAALDSGSTKAAKQMMASVSRHFDGVSVSFDGVATKYEETSKFIDRSTLKAKSLAGEARKAGATGQSISDRGEVTRNVGGTLAAGAWAAAGATFAIAAAPLCLTVGAVAVGAVTTVAAVGGQATKSVGQYVKKEQTRQTAMFESFANAMQNVSAIVMSHKREVLDLQGSLKSLSRDTKKLERLVEDWDGDEEDHRWLATSMRLARDNFKTLEGNCHKFERTERQGMSRVAQALRNE